jgi:hypothetical protein
VTTLVVVAVAGATGVSTATLGVVSLSGVVVVGPAAPTAAADVVDSSDVDVVASELIVASLVVVSSDVAVASLLVVAPEVEEPHASCTPLKSALPSGDELVTTTRQWC